MIKIPLILILILTIFSSCSKKELTGREFDLIWKEYLQREFEESFDEKQSIAQKERILTRILSEYKIDLEEFKSYMKKNHNYKFKKIFME